MEALKGESLAHLRHELRTPVNHILGYSELLIEEAGARHLEAFVPAFQHIQASGRSLLESIQTTLTEKAGSPADLNFSAFTENLRNIAAEVLETSTSLKDTLEDGHRQTLADLEAISWALRRLLDFATQDGQTPPPPPKRASRIPSESSEPAPPPTKRRGGKILIADDDPNNRDLLRRRLECEGHEVVETKSGVEILAYLKDQHCDLVLLDIMMPDMDGFQTLARLKQHPQLRELPVIMISALDELRSVVRCIEMGAEDYLPKPFNRVLLRARIGASLDKKWLRDAERHKTEELERTLQLLEKAQTQLAVLATQDALTGLANRRAVDSQLSSRTKRENLLSVIYIDLNGFKKINDTYGHQAGDELLKQVGERLRREFRSTDFVGRWGGDEFVALVEANFADAQAKVAQVARCFEKEFTITSGDTEQSVSVGAALGLATLRPGESVNEVLQRADADMYRQKLRRIP
jgi:adenylate cyclase